MTTKLALISTGVGVVAPIMAIIKEEAPDTEIFNIVDDSIVRTIAANDNIIPPGIIRRLTGYMVSAEELGVDAVLVTCSSISEVVDMARPYVKIPVFKIDEPMADKAVAMGRRIGVAATLATTLEPTKRLIQSQAKKASKDIIIEDELCPGVFELLIGGNPEKHDEIVKDAVLKLLDRSDVVVLAQASMARAVQGLGPFQERVLTSPRLGVMNVVNYLKSSQS